MGQTLGVSLKGNQGCRVAGVFLRGQSGPREGSGLLHELEQFVLGAVELIESLRGPHVQINAELNIKAGEELGGSGCCRREQRLTLGPRIPGAGRLGMVRNFGHR